MILRIVTIKKGNTIKNSFAEPLTIYDNHYNNKHYHHYHHFWYKNMRCWRFSSFRLSKKRKDQPARAK